MNATAYETFDVSIRTFDDQSASGQNQIIYMLKANHLVLYTHSSSGTVIADVALRRDCRYLGNVLPNNIAFILF